MVGEPGALCSGHGVGERQPIGLQCDDRVGELRGGFLELLEQARVRVLFLAHEVLAQCDGLLDPGIG